MLRGMDASSKSGLLSLAYIPRDPIQPAWHSTQYTLTQCTTHTPLRDKSGFKEVIFSNFISAYFNVLTRQAMNISCNNTVHICNHCFSRRGINITNPKSVCLQTWVSSMQCAGSILSSVTCYALLCFFQILITTAWILKKKKVKPNKICFDFLYNFRLKHF